MKAIMKDIDQIRIRISNFGFVLIIVFSFINQLVKKLFETDAKKPIIIKDEIKTDVDFEVYTVPSFS